MNRGKLSALWIFFLLVLIFASCTTGPMDIRERHYFAVPSGENTNYYRLRVAAKTRFGVSGYRSGWFPADAVDYAFGDVSDKGGIEALKVRNQLKEQINKKILSTNSAWLDEAAKPDANRDKLDGLLRARRRILAYPKGDTPPYEGAFEIEYNPVKGVHTRFSEDKLIFVLASDPDAVIANIASFAENQQTVLAIDRLSGVIAQRTRNEIAASEAIAEVNESLDRLLLEQIKLAEEVVEDSTTTPSEAIQEINTLLILLDSVYP